MTKPGITFVYDGASLEHVPPHGHPESPERLRAIVSQLKSCGLWEQVEHRTPRLATEGEISAIHTEQYREFVRSMCERGGGVLDAGDTAVCPQSFDAALLAAGAVLCGIDAVLTGGTGSAFCAVRPPGHHAERDKAMGFCLFNNVAVGARYAQQQHGLQKVAVLDWDVHHGNGTQHAFEEDATVLYISLHQYPFYPGTGARTEQGRGQGKGFTLNLPFPAGTGESDYLHAFDEAIVPALRRFKPDLLMISAGFDAHRDDPLAGMELTEMSYARMTERIRSIGPIVSVLEGGYNLQALARSVEMHLRALTA